MADNDDVNINININNKDVILELNAHWDATCASVSTGDFTTYKTLYADNAVLVDTLSSNHSSKPIQAAFKTWKSGFDETAAGHQAVALAFRFSQRLHSATTAHETGIFCYSCTKRETESPKISTSIVYVHFESLLVKDERKGWRFVMEYQRNAATKDEWDALKPFIG